MALGPLLLLAAELAWAGCDPITNAAWGSQLDRAALLQRVADVDGASAIVRAVQEDLPCLTEAASPSLFARTGRFLGGLAFLDQDEDRVWAWVQTEWRADPGLGPTPEFPAGHPFHQARRDVLERPTRAPLGPPGAHWDLPPGGSARIDGLPSAAPVATPELPHLVQILDRRGAVIRAWWQDGAAFPEDAVITGGRVPTAKPTPVPADRALLQLGSSPAGAEVWVDGVFVTWTPSAPVALPAGERALELRTEDEVARTTVTLSPATSQRKVWDFQEDRWADGS